jgi:hypothetical protein
MPSLQALRDFKTSFHTIGDEISARAENHIPFEDLELPDHEPLVQDEPLETLPGGGAGLSVDFSPDFSAGTREPGFPFDDALNLGEIPAGDIIPPGGDDTDLLALLDTIPDDLGQFAETPAEEVPADEFGGLDLGGEPGIEAPPDDFGTAGLDLGGEPGIEAPADDFGGADDLSGSLDGLGMDGEAESAGETPADLPAAGDFRIPEDLLGGLGDDLTEASPDDFDTAGLDLGGEPGVEAPPDDFDTAGLELGGEPGIEAPPDDFGGADDLSGSLDGLGMETEAEPAGETPADLPAAGDFSIPGLDLGAEIPADSFDSFDLGGDVLDTNFTGADEDTGEPGGLDEFTLPGIDDVFAGGVPGTGGRTGTRETPEEIEEIQLSETELEQFQKTLAGYPLNLRIACEELIAEQAVAPDLMSKLIKLLIRGAPAKETASLAGKILGRTISIPRGFEKSTGAALEAEQGSFAYIFIHNFLPVLRLFLMIAVATASAGYLIYEFVYTPLLAEKYYKMGYERLFAGEYQRANDRFSQAFKIHRNKKWFFRYAEAFRDERQYLYAEEKYDDLLRFYPRDRKGVLDYAAMETNYLRNYAKAEDLLRKNLLDYAPNDREGLLALGDNSLAWGEIDASKYEDARFSYARLLELYGWTDPVVERMLLYFIRTDNLKEVLPLQAYFTDNKRRKISAASLAELGGYLLDKRLEETRGVPNEYVEQIEGIRDLLLRAVKAEPALPEPHYHLARYYHSLNNVNDEQATLEAAIRAFDSSPEGSVRRITHRIDAQKRYADVLTGSRKFFEAEEQLVKGAGIYENAFSRRLLARSPEFGKLYAALGDLEYFTKPGSMETALQYYRRSEQHGWAPPEMLYRMGAAHYYLEEWRDALERFFTASAELPLNRRLLYALGNASYQRGDYFAAQGYYNRLLDILETGRSRLPLLLPNDQPEYIELAERLMAARNNMGAVYEALADQTGDNRYRSRALGLYSEAARAWDALTRNPQNMIRSLPEPGIYGGRGSSLPQLNTQHMLYPQPGYEPQIFPRLDKDVLEPSEWERLVPPISSLSAE